MKRSTGIEGIFTLAYVYTGLSSNCLCLGCLQFEGIGLYFSVGVKTDPA